MKHERGEKSGYLVGEDFGELSRGGPLSRILLTLLACGALR
jgi:hypothetical protein